MIISGYEKPVEYGVQLIFDPTMAAMVLRAQELYNAAVKDEYERGLKDLNDFYTKYGDFISPFSKDMLRYGQMIGNIRGAVDEAAANGVNLLTSPEGRLFIQRLTHSIDPAEFNRMRTNAKLGFEYLDSIEKAKAKNEFNLNFEDWSLLQEGGPGLFKDFSSANGAMWNRPAPYVYQDLNLFTGHIFDKMEDSFIETLPDHYDYYGVSREARQQALTQHLSGLLSTQLGQYHYLNSKAAYERVIGRKLSDQEAMTLWLRDILDSTQEYEHRNRKLNELYKLLYEDLSRQRAARSSQQPQQTPLWSFMEVLKRNTAASAAGMSADDWGKDGSAVLGKLRDEQIKFGKLVSKNTGGASGTNDGLMQFINQYEKVKYDPSTLVAFLVGSNYKYLDGKAVPRWDVVDNNTIRIKPEDAGRIFGRPDVVSHTTGFRGASRGTDRSIFNAKGVDYIDITLGGGVYGAYTKRDRNENMFRISKITLQKNRRTEIVKNSNGLDVEVEKMDAVPVRGGHTMYFDSHITSNKDPKGTGYLGILNKKGKVVDTPNIPITNTQDQRYQDAIQGDMFMSLQATLGTAYDYSATLPEALGFGLLKTQ